MRPKVHTSKTLFRGSRQKEPAEKTRAESDREMSKREGFPVWQEAMAKKLTGDRV